MVDTFHIVLFIDLCYAGEHVGVFADVSTCEEIGKNSRGMCDQESVKAACCVACADFGSVNTSSTDGDGQCKAKLGPNSYMCRVIHYHLSCFHRFYFSVRVKCEM